MPKSKLYRRLPESAIPFATVKIAGRTYGDNRIKSIKISYGKNGPSTEPVAPTATIEIVGKLPIFYNANVEITININNALERFIGRVGNQSYIDYSNTKKVSTIVATGHSIRLFRDESEFNAYNNVNTLGHAVQFMYTRSLANRVPGGSGSPSAAMWAPDYFREVKKYKAKDILSLFDKIGVATLHHRNGAVRYIHPKDRIEDMKMSLEWNLPIQRSNAISPATHEQATSYVDGNPRLVYYMRGSDKPRHSAEFSRHFPGYELPTRYEDLEISELEYTTDAWKYPARVHLFRTIQKRWSTPSITVDLLTLLNGNKYERSLFNQLCNMEEGGFIVFSGDWDQDLRGAKVVQGIEESITPEGWKITFSLANPSAVFGWSELDNPMPAPLEMTWAQKTGTWGQAKKKWSEE